MQGLLCILLVREEVDGFHVVVDPDESTRSSSDVIPDSVSESPHLRKKRGFKDLCLLRTVELGAGCRVEEAIPPEPVLI